MGDGHVCAHMAYEADLTLDSEAFGEELNAHLFAQQEQHLEKSTVKISLQLLEFLHLGCPECWASLAA